MKITVSQNPKEEDSKLISKGIESYNKGIIGDAATEPDLRFFVFARNKQGEIVGGIRAVAFWNWLQIELLWLDENNRGNGIGKALLAQAEAFAAENGFFLSRVETTSFQAQGFYERQGYAVFAELEDLPKGHSTIFLKKALLHTKPDGKKEATESGS